MTTPSSKRLLVLGALTGATLSGSLQAAPTSPIAAPAPLANPTGAAAAKGAEPESERYLPLSALKQWQAAHAKEPLPILQPTWEGHALKQPMRDLFQDPTFDTAPVAAVSAPRTLIAASGRKPRVGRATAKKNGKKVAAKPLPPSPVASVRPAVFTPKLETPRWVRYPLEFQLGGIGLGTKAVDKDKYNRIDRYGLFALHGNPTAVVVPSNQGFGINVNQQPPEVPALFPANQGGGMPDWASAITVSLDNNHVEWLYRRDTYSMGFIVDRLGYVDAIVIAGVQSNIAKTQLEDPVHSVKLGDDFRKVVFRYGYPDTIETYTVGVSGVTTGVDAGAAAAAGGATAGGAGAGAAGAAGAGAAAPGGGTSGGDTLAGAGAAAATNAGNTAYRTFEVRYEQSYNAVFTIRNNRVVRMYIFGDPDFFNERRRQSIRSSF